MLDESVVTMAKAIRQTESGGDYMAQGGSGEKGAYQFMPDTWKGWAKDILGNSNAPMTPSNQNKVAYTKIKQWKDQGYKPDQVASLWNAGTPVYAGRVGVNKYGVKYDTPSYVQKVTSQFDAIKKAAKAVGGAAMGVAGVQQPSNGPSGYSSQVPFPEVDTGANIPGESFETKHPLLSLPVTIAKDILKTFARPFGEVAASAAELSGNQALIDITKDLPRLSNPAVNSYINQISSGVGHDEVIQTIRKQQEAGQLGGDQGAGFNDVLNVLQFLPGGAVVKEAGIAKDVFTAAKGGKLLSTLGKGAWAGAKVAAPWGAAYGMANELDKGTTDIGQILDAGVQGLVVGGAFGGVLGVGGVAVGKGAQAISKRFEFAENFARQGVEDIVNMTPTMKDLARKRGINIPQILIDHDLVGLSKENQMLGMEKVARDWGAKGEALVQNSKFADTKFNLTDLEKETLSKIYNHIDDEGLKINSTEYNKYIETIKNSFKNVKDMYGETVDARVLDVIKKDFGEKSFGADVKVTNEAKAIAFSVVRDKLNKTITDVPMTQLNAKLSEVLTARRILQKTVNKPMGGKWATWAVPVLGGLLGSTLGPAGTLAGVLGGAAYKEALIRTVNNPEVMGMVYKYLLRYAKVQKAEDPFLQAIQKQIQAKFSNEVKLLTEGKAPVVEAMAPGKLSEIKAGQEAIVDFGNLASEKISKIKSGEIFGHTFNLDGSDYVGTDFIATLRSKNVPITEASSGNINKILEEAKFTYRNNPNVKVGIYKMDDKNVSIDINFSTSNKEEAEMLGKVNNQKSIWDALNQQEIQTGGTGE